MPDVNAIAALLSDFTTRLNDVEERLKIMHERVTILDQTFLKQNQKVMQEIKTLDEEISEIKEKLEKIEEAIQHIMLESQEFARREELESIEKFIKMWEPMNFATLDDVREMLKKIKKKDVSR